MCVYIYSTTYTTYTMYIACAVCAGANKTICQRKIINVFWTIRKTRAGGPASRGSVKTGSLEAGGAQAIASVAFAEHRDRVGPLLLEGLSNRASGSNTGGPSQPQTRAPEAVTSAPPRF